MAAEATSLLAVGLSHHTAPVSVRERFAMDADAVRAELEFLTQSKLAREAFFISTCNRVELYAVPSPGREAAVRDRLAIRHGVEGSSYFYRHIGADAVRHLFRVTSSLDSLVVGEPQILGQVKQALKVAEEAASLGTILHRLAQRSLWVAKQVRTRTDIGRHNVGIGNAGVALARQIFSTLKGRRVLLVGVGEMGRQVARAMLTHGVDELLVANRTFDKAVELAEAHGGTPVPYDRVRDYLPRVDIVITATGATRPILAAVDIQAALKQRRYRPLFLVDLSVPRNIDEDVERLDQAYLFNVDDLVKVMERGRAARQEASTQAEAICSQEASRFVEQLAVLEVNDDLAAITRWANEVRLAEIAKSKRLEGLTEEQAAAVDAMSKGLVKKLLHGPLQEVRAAAKAGQAERLAWLLEALGHHE